MSTDAIVRNRPTEYLRNTAVSVIAPAYNESKNIEPLVRECIDSLDEVEEATPYEIILIDDGSEDDTPHTIRRLSNQHQSVIGVILKRNYGQSAALSAGFRHATGDVIVPIDADLQNDPRDIPKLLDTLSDGNDCVVGRRPYRNRPLGKRIPSAIQTWLAKATGPDINDFGCTLKAVRREAVLDLDLYGEGHRYIPSKLHTKGYSVTEVGVNHRSRRHGESHYGGARLLRGFSDLMWHWFWNGYGTRPFHLFGGGGFVIMGLGILLGLWLLTANYLGDAQLMAQLPELILSVAMVLFGTLIVVFGVVLEFLTKLYYRDEPPYRVESVVD